MFLYKEKSIQSRDVFRFIRLQMFSASSLHLQIQAFTSSFELQLYNIVFFFARDNGKL